MLGFLHGTLSFKLGEIVPELCIYLCPTFGAGSRRYCTRVESISRLAISALVSAVVSIADAKDSISTDSVNSCVARHTADTC